MFLDIDVGRFLQTIVNKVINRTHEGIGSSFVETRGHPLPSPIFPCWQ